MRQHGLCSLIFALVLLAALAKPAAHARAEALPPSLTEQVARLLPAVVEIRTTVTTPQGRMYFDGSGFIIEPSGIIATNRHVIAGAYEIRVYVPGLPPLKARPLFISEGIDLALLKVDAGKELPAVKLGDSDTVQIGDRVMLLGNPLGVGESLSFGVVSALNRDIGETLYDHFIQTDAALNHGNSGGAMFNIAGEVIGINTGLTSSPGNTGSIGIGYAMPINDAKFVIDQYLRDGRVIAGTVGVRAQRMTEDLAEAFGLPRPRGAIVTGVAEDGPAAGKIRAGDIVLMVGQQDATDTRAVARLIATTPPGQTLNVTLLRNGTEQHVAVTVAMMQNNPKKAMAVLGHAPEQAKVFATPSDPGMELSAIDEAARRKFALAPDQKGVVVTGVNPKGVAAERKIAVGDVIVSVNGQAVNAPQDVQQRLREVADRHAPFAALLVAGERSTHWVALPLEADR
jgi:serine protease Do